jgi:hypothetical protein
VLERVADHPQMQNYFRSVSATAHGELYHVVWKSSLTKHRDNLLTINLEEFQGTLAMLRNWEHAKIAS